MIVVDLDVETTGLDHHKDRIIEVAMSATCTNTNRIISCYSSLVWDTDYPKITEDIIKLTSVTQDILEHHACTPEQMVKNINAFITGTDAKFICAYNSDFDRKFVLKEFDRYQYAFPDLKWIDGAADLFDQQKMQKLTLMCAEHGFLNPFPHWAIADTLSLSKLRSFYRHEEIIERINTPKAVVLALWENPFSVRGQEIKEYVKKQLGFRWNDNGHASQWSKIVRQSDLHLYSHVNPEWQDLSFKVLLL
jgi:DNA polymerase-3 subunit epsilon